MVAEAVRGEGATLLGAGGPLHRRLAPRDAVTLAVLERMATDGTGHMLLDLRNLGEARFPNVSRPYDGQARPSREPIPVSPGTPYVIGGVASDLEGRSTLSGLFAVGECASHRPDGANRLASTRSPVLVLGARAASAAVDPAAGFVAAADGEAIPAAPGGWRFDPPAAETRDAVSRLAGPLRSAEDVEEFLSDPCPLARLIARFALERREGRGALISELSSGSAIPG